MSLTPQSILETLRTVMDPDVNQSIVDLDSVDGINIEGGSVSFDVETMNPICAHREDLKANCEAAALALDGISEATATIKPKRRFATMAQRQVLPSVSNIIAVASGKGGVGKSTTSTNLAMALRMAGANVGILDADIYGPSVPTMIRTEEPPNSTKDSQLIPGSGMGIKLMSMGYFMNQGQAAILRGPMVSGAVQQFLNQVEWGQLDYLIVDYPPGTGDIQLTLSQQAPITGAIVVTTPQNISLIDVERAIMMFEKTGVPVLGIVETMSYFICSNCDKRHTVFREGGGERIADEIGVPFLGGIPIDPRIAEGGDVGVPVVQGHPSSDVADNFREIAQNTATQLAIYHTELDQCQETFSLEWNVK